MYLGFPSPLDSGLVTTLDLMGNKGTVCISKVHGGTGTNVTKQWSKVHHSDGITKLSMACTMMLEQREGLEFAQKDNAERALLSSQWRLQVLFALFLASLIVSCA